MIYDIESDAYEMEVPQDLKITADGIAYVVKVKEIIENTHLFHCVTSYEDYNYVLGEYVKNQMHIFSNEVQVLLLYYDERLALHTPMPVRVSIEEAGDEVSILDVSYRVNKRVKSFQEWQSELISLKAESLETEIPTSVQLYSPEYEILQAQSKHCPITCIAHD
ncbi:hypothetical protein [Pontibacter chinhatensis]|nr:hypothetical protein [Pontibacter chinhatensis]